MKKVVLRSAPVAIILTAAVSFITWWMIMRREIPEHARVIPREAFAIATLNLRELFADHAGEEHLFPEMQDESILKNELEPFMRAIEGNGGSGIEEMADVLLFTYSTAEEGFFGICIQLEDSATFGNLVRIHVANEYNIQPWTSNGVPVVRFDTSAAVIGWSEDAALFLYPLGHHSIAVVAQQCILLLKQTPENSVLANQNFCDFELKSFDMGLWIHKDPFMKFTGGGDLAEQMFSGIQYCNYAIDFTDGEILARSEWYLENEDVHNNIQEIALPSESKDIIAFMRVHLDTENDSLFEHYANSPPLNDLPLNDEECLELLPFLKGDAIMVLHDTLTFQDSYIEYVYDSNFNRVEVRRAKTITSSSHSTSFSISDEAKVNELITRIMTRDSIPLTNRGWIYQESGMETRLILSGNMLTVTSCPEADGRSHMIPAEMTGYMVYANLRDVLAQLSNDDGVLGWFIPSLKQNGVILSENLVSLTNTIPVQFNGVCRSEVVLKFRNEEINALVQAEEIIRKIYYSQSQ